VKDKKKGKSRGEPPQITKRPEIQIISRKERTGWETHRGFRGTKEGGMRNKGKRNPSSTVMRENIRLLDKERGEGEKSPRKKKETKKEGS